MNPHKSWRDAPDHTALMGYALGHLSDTQVRRLTDGYMSAGECETLCEAHIVASFGFHVCNYANRRDTLTDSQYVNLCKVRSVAGNIAAPENRWSIYGEDETRSVVLVTVYGIVAEFSLDEEI